MRAVRHLMNTTVHAAVSSLILVAPFHHAMAQSVLQRTPNSTGGWVGVVGGAVFVRVDVPRITGDYVEFTKLFGAQSIYCITPVTKEAATAAATKLRERPMSEWDLPDEWRQAMQQGRLEHHDDEF